MNDYDVRVVRTHGDFTWHSHPDTDKLFIVLTGSLTIRSEDCDVVLAPATCTSSHRGPDTNRSRPRGRRCCWSSPARPSTRATLPATSQRSVTSSPPSNRRYLRRATRSSPSGKQRRGSVSLQPLRHPCPKELAVSSAEASCERGQPDEEEGHRDRNRRECEPVQRADTVPSNA